MTSEFSPRILLSAYQCGPGMGSVSQIGWAWYSRLARRLPVTLVTHVRNREALALAGAPLCGSEVVYIDTEWFAGPLYRFASRLFPQSEHAVFLMSSLDFFAYDRQAVKTLRGRMRRGEAWDLAHAVTPVSTVAPTHLHRLGAPVVLGPLNAGLRSPSAFPDIMRSDSGWLYPVRHAGRIADAWIGSSRRAMAFLTATRATRESIPRAYRRRCIAMLENGVELKRFAAIPWPPFPSSAEPLRLLFVGRLVPFKGVSMLLEAVARVRDAFPVTLTVVGSGPMEAAWKQVAAQMNLGDAVRFTGALPLDGVAAQMRRAHLFCLPSVRESGGAVLLEAMASARPVAAVAYGGPAEIVDDAVGRAIPPDGSEAVISGFADVFRDVAQNPDQWRKRGETGRRRAEHRYGWDAKIEAAVRIYQRVLNR